MTAVVDHPEVDERLYVHECVVRVACPRCKMKAGVPCQGARFEWPARGQRRGQRRGFRYTQETHGSRRQLFQAWKAAGRRRQYPADVYARFERAHGRFPKAIDYKTIMPEQPKPTSSKCKSTSGKRKARRASGSSNRWARTPVLQIEHRGTIWEGIEGNALWSWMPYREYRDFTHISVFDMPEHLGGVHLTFEGHEHKCTSREEAFDLAIELVVKAGLLAVLNERIEWRIEELERRFGHLMEETA